MEIIQSKTGINNTINLESIRFEDLIIFPGNQDEYERFKGYKVEIIDTGLIDKYFYVRYVQQKDSPKPKVREGFYAIIKHGGSVYFRDDD
ncbi:MAG: hypothetical protein AABX55_03320, partial [Nanoarchaeota archaeon]